MPLLTHPTEWPEATKRGLTHKLGPLPVWAWGVVVVGGIVAYRLLAKSSGKNTTEPLNTLLPQGVGSYGEGGGGGGGILGSDVTAPSTGAGASAGGVGSTLPGSVPQTAVQTEPAGSHVAILADPYMNLMGAGGHSTATGVTNWAADALQGVDRNWLLAQKPETFTDVQWINRVGFLMAPGSSGIRGNVQQSIADAKQGTP